MIRLTFCATLISLTATLAGHAQQTKSADQAAVAAYAYARGDDSYLMFSDKYNADKKYVVLKLWNEREPLSDAEKTELAYLKKNLLKKNIEVVDFQWKNAEDLQEALKKYNLSVEVSGEKHINLKAENFNLNTTSGKALLVLEDNKPVSLCSGKECESHLKDFFKMRSLD